MYFVRHLYHRELFFNIYSRKRQKKRKHLKLKRFFHIKSPNCTQKFLLNETHIRWRIIKLASTLSIKTITPIQNLSKIISNLLNKHYPNNKFKFNINNSFIKFEDNEEYKFFTINDTKR
jgi:hypothetical protein